MNVGQLESSSIAAFTLAETGRCRPANAHWSYRTGRGLCYVVDVSGKKTEPILPGISSIMLEQVREDGILNPKCMMMLMRGGCSCI